jgi:hypothetical protein
MKLVLRAGAQERPVPPEASNLGSFLRRDYKSLQTQSSFLNSSSAVYFFSTHSPRHLRIPHSLRCLLIHKQSVLHTRWYFRALATKFFHLLSTFWVSQSSLVSRLLSLHLLSGCSILAGCFARRFGLQNMSLAKYASITQIPCASHSF